MSTESMPSTAGPKAPAVTFGTYVAPETVREYLPPEPAAPVQFAPTPASNTPSFQTPFGKAAVKFTPDLVVKGGIVLAVFFAAALAGYLSIDINRTDAGLRTIPVNIILQTQTGPRLTSRA